MYEEVIDFLLALNLIYFLPARINFSLAPSPGFDPSTFLLQLKPFDALTHTTTADILVAMKFKKMHKLRKVMTDCTHYKLSGNLFKVQYTILQSRYITSREEKKNKNVKNNIFIINFTIYRHLYQYS